MVEDEDLLLAVLNSAPVVAGAVSEELDGDAGTRLARRWGGQGSQEELAHLRRVRGALQAAVRGQPEAHERVVALLGQAALVPAVSAAPVAGQGAGITWVLRAAPAQRLGARAVLAWSRVGQQLPGRLKACANDGCNRFLLDRSRPGTARWCSMATCGNRAKVRAHAARQRDRAPGGAYRG